MRIRNASTVALAALVMALAASTASGAVPKNFFGVVQGGRLHTEDPQTMANSGAASMRIFIPWASVEPERGTFDWSNIDPVVSQLAEQGRSTFPFLYGTPKWLAPESDAAPLGAKKKPAWTFFLKEAVRRYGRGGDFWVGVGGLVSPFHLECECISEPRPITAWQIWNEANYINYWKGKPSPIGYARLVKISHKAITAVDKRAKIVLAGLKPVRHSTKNTAWNFLSRMYQVPGIKNAFDATALHPYPDRVVDLRRAVQRVHAAQVRHGDGHTPLWITELGWGSGDPSLSHLNKGLDGQAQLLRRSFRLILHNRKRWSIGRLLWFSLRDGGGFSAGCDFCRTAGLLNEDGSPKPSFSAYERFAK